MAEVDSIRPCVQSVWFRGAMMKTIHFIVSSSKLAKRTKAGNSCSFMIETVKPTQAA